jgi:hypothetical protein
MLARDGAELASEIEEKLVAGELDLHAGLEEASGQVLPLRQPGA